MKSSQGPFIEQDTWPTALPRRHYIAGLLAFCVIFSGTFFSSYHRLTTNSGDFNQFLQDARLASDTGQLGRVLPLEYPPTARPLFMLMAVPPPRCALAVWWLLHVWLFWQSAVWLGGWFPRTRNRDGLIAASCVIALAVTGVVSDLSVGQLTGLILFCMVGSLELDRRGHSLAAGALIAVSLLVKPLPVVMLLYFLLRRRWALLGGAAATYLVLGPLLLVMLFGWDNHLEGWRSFFETTVGERSPSNVFHRWSEMQGHCLTYRESGLAASLIRLFTNVTYEKAGGSVQIATAGPDALLTAWSVIIIGLIGWASWTTVRRSGLRASIHCYAAFAGIMLLANPKFISYWLAVPMLAAAPLAARWRACFNEGRRDRLGLAALCVWVLCGLSVGMAPVLRAAGSIPLGILVLTVANLLQARRPWPDACRRGGLEPARQMSNA